MRLPHCVAGVAVVCTAASAFAPSRPSWALPVRSNLAATRRGRGASAATIRSSAASPGAEQATSPAPSPEPKSASDDELDGQISQLRAQRREAAAKLAAADLALARLEKERSRGKQGELTAEDGSPLIFDFNYGYLSKSSGVYIESFSDGEGGPPANVFTVASKNFMREVKELVNQARGVPPQCCTEDGLCVVDEADTSSCRGLRAQLATLELSNEAIWKREEEREQIPAPFVLKAPYVVLCWVIDTLFENRPLPRFWFLETVARMPYFSYISMLHLYESLGWWRRSAEIKRVHFAEEWNEFHHLLIMEALGGDQRWTDRFFAQHAAVFYYWILVTMWLLSPSIAYNFSQLIEAHAVDTYGEFRDANEELLKQLPPPQIALQYYCGEDLYYFDEFQSAQAKGSRRPKCNNLHDVFVNIADDEAEHVKTMASCQDPEVIVRSPNAEAAVLTAAAVTAAAAKVLENSRLEELDPSEIVIQMPELFDQIYDLAESIDLNALVESITQLL